MSEDLAKLNAFKNQIQVAQQARATVQGRQQSLHEKATQLSEKMKSEFQAKSLTDLEKKIAQKKAEADTLATELEGIFGVESS